MVSYRVDGRIIYRDDEMMAITFEADDAALVTDLLNTREHMLAGRGTSEPVPPVCNRVGLHNHGPESGGGWANHNHSGPDVQLRCGP